MLFLDMLMILSKSGERRDRVVAGAWMIAVAPAMAVATPLFFLAYGVTLIVRRKPL